MKLITLLFLLFFAFNYAMEEDWLSNKQNITEYYWQKEPYIDLQEDVTKGLHDIENIDDLMQLFEKSGKQEMSPTEEVIDLAIPAMTHNNKKRKIESKITIEIAQPFKVRIDIKKIFYYCFLCKKTIIAPLYELTRQLIQSIILDHLVLHETLEKHLPEKYKKNFQKREKNNHVCFICGQELKSSKHIKNHFILTDTDNLKKDGNSCILEIQVEGNINYSKDKIFSEVNLPVAIQKFYGINLLSPLRKNKTWLETTCPLCPIIISGNNMRPFMNHIVNSHFTMIKI